jgi:hypothetical protein
MGFNFIFFILPVVAVLLGDNPEISLRGVMQTVDEQLLP